MGWRSDAPSVATVSDAGVVTGISNGLANIYVEALGAQGLRQVRVLPNFAGRWAGRYITSSCTATGDFANKLEYCTAGPARQGVIGLVRPMSMTITQSGASISGTFLLGSVPFTSFNGSIDDRGSVVFSGVSTEDRVIDLDVTWKISSPQVGRITGAFTTVLRSRTTYSGEAREGNDIVDLTR